jgi:hypothetical protein
LANIIDRKLVLSYRSFLFLKENSFSFGKAFSKGVPYLSRAEGELARTLYLPKRRRQGLRCVNVWSRKFYSNMATKVSAWLEANPRSVSFMMGGRGVGGVGRGGRMMRGLIAGMFFFSFFFLGVSILCLGSGWLTFWAG